MYEIIRIDDDGNITINLTNVQHKLVNTYNLNFSDNCIESKGLTIIAGPNGIGKSNFLKVLRQCIVRYQNAIYPNYIVRLLEKECVCDSYDPYKKTHPLIKENKIEEIFNKIKHSESNSILERKKFEFFEEQLKLGASDFKITEENEYMKDKIKVYLKRQLAKQFSYGNLEQLLSYDVPYDFEITKINEYLGNNEHDLEFKYEILPSVYDQIDKNEISEIVNFRKRNDRKTIIKLKDLSSGERLILTILLTIREPELMKIKLDNNIKKIFLMDEPDAHLESKVVSVLIRIIKNIIIKDFNIQVIMTSHNIESLCSVEKYYLLSKTKDENYEITEQTSGSNFHLFSDNKIITIENNTINIETLCHEFCFVKII